MGFIGASLVYCLIYQGFLFCFSHNKRFIEKFTRNTIKKSILGYLAKYLRILCKVS